jgi:hypothetical protein
LSEKKHGSEETKLSQKAKRISIQAATSLLGFSSALSLYKQSIYPLGIGKASCSLKKIPSKHTTGDTLGCRTCGKSHWKKYP